MLMAVSQFNIEKYLENLRPEIDKIIEKYLPRKISKKWTIEVFGKPEYNFSLKAIQGAILDPIWNFLDRGGKRWRPALFLLTLEALNGNVKKFKDLAIIPEILHNSSLIVDDVEDQGELRRGKPCLHKVFGMDVALNVGNFFYFFPIFILKKNERKFKKDILLKLIETYLHEMERVHLGQATDIFWHRGKQSMISEKEYLQMCAFKTGCMARLAVKLAVILAGKENLVEKMGRFAQAIGIAFQIQDDILDISLSGQRRKKFGKAFGNDIKEGKRSLMVIYTLKKAKKEDRKKLIDILNKHTDSQKEKIEAIRIIEKYGALKYAEKRAKNIVKESWSKIEKDLPESLAKNKLENLSKYLTEREF